MAKLHTVLLATCAVLLALAAPLLTGDPDMFQDICVADFKSLQGPLGVNGYPCKREMNVTVDDFFGGLAKAADVYSGNPMGQGRIHRVCRVGYGIPWGPAIVPVAAPRPAVRTTTNRCVALGRTS